MDTVLLLQNPLMGNKEREKKNGSVFIKTKDDRHLLLCSLDSLPGGAELDEHPLLADTSLLIQLNEPQSLGHTPLQVIGEPTVSKSSSHITKLLVSASIGA